MKSLPDPPTSMLAPYSDEDVRTGASGDVLDVAAHVVVLQTLAVIAAVVQGDTHLPVRPE